ncbi:MAG: hypothetical protein C5B43_05025 [Verrucomicrobia bacterium]|nr:MAG: hypothetical protein C5B43_05025 [Verrucomicrobiota bacterium]
MRILLHLLKTTIVYWTLLISCYSQLPELSSNEPIECDEATQEIILRGDAELSSDKALIKADEIRLNNETFNTTASGNVKINMNDLRLLGDSIQYNVSTETLNSQKFRAGNSPNYISGNSASGTLNDLSIQNATLLLAEPDCFSPTLCTSCVEIKNVHDDNIPTQIIARNVWFKVGCIPFFYLPYFSYTIQDIPFQIVSQLGDSKEYGPFIRNMILFRATPCLSAGALIDFYRDRGFLIGPAFKFITNCKNKETFSDFKSGFIHDQGTKNELGKDSVGRRTPRSRNFIEWYHQQSFSENFQITGQLRRWSDSNALRDFRPKLFNNDNDPDNFVEAVYTGPNYFLTAFTRYSPNNFQDVPQRLPELNFQLLPTPIPFTRIYQTINARIAHLHSHSPRHLHRHDKKHKNKRDNFTSDRLDIYYGLHTPFNYQDILTFTPTVGGQIDEYFYKNTSKGSYTRLRGQLGFDLQLNAFSQMDCTNGTWGINGLRHIVRPTLQYRFIPQHNSGRRLIPKIDRHIFTTNINPIDLNHQRDIDSAHAQHVARIGLENLLQTRSCNYGSRDLAYFNIYQDYYIKENRRHHHWSYLYSEFGLSPAYWINFSLYNRIDVRRPKLSELNTSLTLTDARFWTLNYTTSFLHKKAHSDENRLQHNLKATWYLTPLTHISGEGTYDFKLHKITKETYAIFTQFCNAWGAELQLTHRRKAVRESKWEVGLVFKLLPIHCNLVPIPLPL